MWIEYLKVLVFFPGYNNYLLTRILPIIKIHRYKGNFKSFEKNDISKKMT